jgi:hypothetical protein
VRADGTLTAAGTTTGVGRCAAGREVITMNRRTWALALATALTFAVVMTPGAAYAIGPVVQISPPSGPPGTIIKVTGSGFCAAPCEPVHIFVGPAPVGDDVPITADGRFGVEVQVPEGIRQGEQPVVAVQHDTNGADLLGRTVFMVTLAPPTRVQPPVGPSSGPEPADTPGVVPPSQPPSRSPVAAASGGGPAPNYPGLAVVAVVAAIVIAAFLALAHRIRRQSMA